MKRLSRLREMSTEQQAVNRSTMPPKEIQKLNWERQLELARWNKDLVGAARIQRIIDQLNHIEDK